MFAVVVTLTVNAADVAAFLPLIERNARRSLEHETGCLQFDVATDPSKPDEVFLYELYTDEAAFQTHLKTDHFLEFDQATKSMLSAKSVSTYRKVQQ